MAKIIAPAQIADSLSELWSPQVIAIVDDVYVKVAKLHGELTWHHHEKEDELFLVLKGNLRIQMEQETVELGEGDLYVVPKGVRHNPIADEECQVLLVERKSTQHTGDVITEKTRTISEQLRVLE